MDERNNSSQRIIGLAVWIAGLALHSACLLAVWRFHTGNQPLMAAVALGLLLASSVVFILPGLFARQWYATRSTFYGFTAAVTLCLPGIGIIGCLFALLCSKLLLRQKNKTKEFKLMIEADLGDDSRWITRKRVGQVLADEIAIEPVIDVLQGDDPDLKRGAVKLLQRIGTPNAVGLLRQSLSDQFPEVRFYAHSALTELEDGFSTRIQDLIAKLQETPSALTYRLLGQQYRTYADSGLADEIARRQHLESCCDALIKSLALEPGHNQTMLLLGQALLEQVVYDPESGQLLTGSLMDYAVPHADIMPAMFETHMDERIPCKNNVLGVKGVGELGTIGATPALVNAVADALARHGRSEAAPHLQMPLTAYRLWSQLQN